MAWASMVSTFYITSEGRKNEHFCTTGSTSGCHIDTRPGGDVAKLLLAWEISTSPYSDLRDGKEALQLLEPEPTNYFDKVRILETKA